MVNNSEIKYVARFFENVRENPKYLYLRSSDRGTLQYRTIKHHFSVDISKSSTYISVKGAFDRINRSIESGIIGYSNINELTFEIVEVEINESKWPTKMVDKFTQTGKIIPYRNILLIEKLKKLKKKSSI
ncbi:MAG: hypothetical protein ACOC3V_03800 [bacterium]